jgi:UDP-N-acetylglucosamine 2-epimerase (non-hydrolysing)
MQIMHVVGARPNFMKAAPVMRALEGYEGVRQILVHTGQHYDVNMSDVFVHQLRMRPPEVNLAVGSGSHARQTAEIMSRLESVVLDRKPDVMLVYGDVNSALAAALLAAKLIIPVGHVEAGLRAFDRTMPEEVNRVVIDHIADLLFTPSVDGDENLRREGVAPDRIHLVGNVMIDSLLQLLPEASARRPRPEGRSPDTKRYGLVTLHRPSNVDAPAVFAEIIAALTEISRDLPLIFPAHPRVRRRLQMIQEVRHESQLRVVDPLGYLEFLALQQHATVVITDSGGVQEEATYLGVPCLTVRESTERPITITLGTNVLVGRDMDRLRREVARILGGHVTPGTIPPLWDGRAAERVAHALMASIRR